MHGLALSVLLDSQATKFISKQSLTKPLEFVIETSSRKPTVLWSRLELLSRYEKIMISLYRRYVSIMNFEKANRAKKVAKLNTQKTLANGLTRRIISKKIEPNE